MATYESLPSVVFRGHTTNDPEAVGVLEVEIPFNRLFPYAIPEGGSSQAEGGSKRGPLFRRYRIPFESAPFMERSTTSSEWLDVGVYDLMIEVLTQNFKWIYRVYRSYGNHGLGYYPMATPTNGDTLFNLTTDTPAGICPLPIELADELTVSEMVEGLVDVAGFLVGKTRRS